MKKSISRIIFVLMIIVFIYNTCFAVSGVIELREQIAILDSNDAGGLDYWGLGIDIFLILFFGLSVFEMILSVASIILAQNRFMKTASFVVVSLLILEMVLCPLFVCY